MKLLFVHDHKFYEKDGELYSYVEFGEAMWERYLSSFSKVKIASRIYRLKENVNISEINKSTSRYVTYCKPPIINGVKNLLLNYKKSITFFKKEIDKADAVIIRLPSENGLIAEKVCRTLNKPYLIELVGCPKDAYFYQGSFMAKLYSPVISNRVSRAVKTSDQVLYVTKKYLQNKYPNNKHTIGCSNVVLKNPRSSITNRINQIDTKRHNELLVGLIGSLESNYKGIDTAIKAINILKKSGINIQLQILGKGNCKKWKKLIKKLGVQENVTFVGTLPSGEPVLKWLDRLDAYIQPSKTEGLPRSLIEAMSRGLPCIATNVGGIPELLGKDYLVRPGDYKNLAEKLEKLITSKSEMIKSAKLNFNKAKEYEFNKITEERKAFFEEFAEKVKNNSMR